MLLKGYTFLYNALLSGAWGYVLFLVVNKLHASNGNTDGIYAACEMPLKYAQTAALMEVPRSATPRESQFRLTFCAFSSLARSSTPSSASCALRWAPQRCRLPPASFSSGACATAFLRYLKMRTTVQSTLIHSQILLL